MRRTPYLLLLLTALAAGGAAQPAGADVSLPKVFSSHMVLQRDRALPVWGWAAAGEEITVKLGDGPAQKTKANDKGEWRVTLPAAKAGGPLSLTVTGANTITVEDVMVGEVWLCSGQSNMQMTVSACDNAQEEIANANYPQMRAFTLPRVTASVPSKDANAAWQVATPQNVGGTGPWSGWTACGYFMGRELHKKLNVPIGIIDASWGGTRIEPWVPPVGFAQVPALTDISKQVLLADPRTPERKEALGAYVAGLEKWMQGARQAMAQDALEETVPAFPDVLVPMAARRDPQQQPTTLYNAMVHPVCPYAIRGAIWYQGESNHGEGKLYTEKMKALIGGWRALWGEGDFPFYYVQIAPFRYGSENPAVLAEFWEAQAAALAIPKTGMVVTTDISMLDDIHPRNKQEVGRRLALLALKNDYGQNDVVCSGPTFKEMSVEGNKLRIRFDNVGGGLVSRDGKPLDWFEIIGKETDFVKADAVIDGDSVLLSSPEVKEPVAMRFAWDKLAEPNLRNKEGLPAVPFRAGQVPDRDYLALKVPEAKEYQLVYQLDLAKAPNVAYDVDRSKEIAGAFDRVAYFLELQRGTEATQWVYASMDAFTDNLALIGVPTVASKAKFQTNVAHLNVLSNVAGVTNGNDQTGGIEFWPNNYGPQNSANVPNASNDSYDFGDQPVDPEGGYGCMQVNNIGAKQTVLAVNNWNAGPGGDLGIGNSDPKATPQHNLDWTFAGNAGSYTVKKLRVLVHLKK